MTCNQDVELLIQELREASRLAPLDLSSRAADMLDKLLVELNRRGKLLTECQDIATVLRHENDRFRRILNNRSLPLLRNTAAADMDQLIDLHNRARLDASWLWRLGNLAPHNALMTYAQEHANWMAGAQELKHSSIGAILKLGFSRAGENIAMGQKTPESVLRSWLWSPGHRANILSRNFNRLGCGAAFDKKQRLYWCVCFGRD
jgi:uncharacterized protein YkwD